ncbi:hypothetical protein BST81_25300 [Leptolyngbya sp. 'hensonii']|uniref:pentapeptide repeat-containing protein n=1 Tax=Leptolyngbya sp. 'hensonii' TaxID=1922337 RepID=UPI00094F572D|nr:pentapeptide repeat-containing protein [Leptolyngbya sp. 'hensonii']OLP15596.1 hypothetical protein BST81_25300 [Leptolyngbya sp. 'hensonii']
MDVSRLLSQYATGQFNFEGAVLKQVNLVQVQLPFVILDEAILQKADLRRANLAGASLNRADLSLADLTNINLIGADLIRAKLARANLTRALLSGADLRGANLRKADLSHASLSSADLSGADFSGAILDHANFEGANLRGANFSNTDLDRVDVNPKDLEGAILSFTQNAQFFGFNHEDNQTNFLSASPFDESTGIVEVVTQGRSALETQDDLSSIRRSVARQPEEGEVHAFLEAGADEVPIAPVEKIPLGRPEQAPATAFVVYEDETGGQVNGHPSLARRYPDLPPNSDPEIRNTKVFQSIQSVLQRRVQFALQQTLLKAYNYRCAITGCNIRPLLEVTFISESADADFDDPLNGLILRVDIRNLFYLHLIAIEPENFRVLLDPSLKNSEYGPLENRSIFLPADKRNRPSRIFLAEHLSQCQWYSESLPSQVRGLEHLQNFCARMIFHSLKFVRQGVDKVAEKPVRFSTGMGVGILVLAGLFWLGSPQGIGRIWSGRPATDITVIQNTKADLIHLGYGPISYQNQGLILNNKSYLSWEMAEQLGLNLQQVPDIQKVRFQGQLYLKTDSLKKAGITFKWEREKRMIFLNSRFQLKVSKINLELNGRPYAQQGILVGQSGYLPVHLLKNLQIDQEKIPANSLIKFRNETFFKATVLKQFNVSLDWNLATRIMGLKTVANSK